jgi:hypothetical protein
MNISMVEQQSDEWWKLKVGKVGGSRFGSVISGRKNRLIYELMDEILNGYQFVDDYVNEEMQYGLDNEAKALELYQDQTGIKVNRIGAIISDQSGIHLASPDGLSECKSIVQEVKCTMYGYTHLQRVFEGVDSTYLPQCINYFAVCDEVQEVHFVSYCGFRQERPLHIIKLNRADYTKEIETGRAKIQQIESELTKKLDEYRF